MQALENFLKTQGIKKKWFAQQMGVSPSFFNEILKYNRKIPPRYWRRIVELTDGFIPLSLIVKHYLDSVEEELAAKRDKN